MNDIPVKRETIVRLANYLMGRPMGEVEGLVNEIRAAVIDADEAAEQAAKVIAAKTKEASK